MFLIRNKKNNINPCKPQFYYIKVGLKGVKIIRHVFMMGQKDRSIFSQYCYKGNGYTFGGGYSVKIVF